MQAIAVNQQWAGSVGALIRKWNPAHNNESSPLFAWGSSCSSAEAAKAIWKVGTRGELSLEYGGSFDSGEAATALCLEKDRNGVGLRECNASSPAQGYMLNTS
eukprot:COSAG01_NODE_22447_length_855_cov_1.169312_1_plen_102_part_10